MVNLRVGEESDGPYLRDRSAYNVMSKRQYRGGGGLKTLQAPSAQNGVDADRGFRRAFGLPA